MKEHRLCIIAPFDSLKPAMNAAEYLQVHRWNCAACASAYDLGSIESALIAVVQQQERAYQLQDLKCSKCRNVSAHIVCSSLFSMIAILAVSNS